MNSHERNEFLKEKVEKLELPDSAYEKAEVRYKDIGNWLKRKESKCSGFEPHVFLQGSFRLGTAIYPLDENEPYDLDIACKLTVGISKSRHTQHGIKNLVGSDIISYQEARNIKAEVEEKHRCWRLDYADELSFHIDIVPCIPEDETQKIILNKSMIEGGYSELLAKRISDNTVAITDDRHPNYNTICDDWLISNPQGYALWFEDRMKQATELLTERAKIFEVATIDELPYFRWKNPLQRCIQLLKRHRDIMFRDNKDAKPISIIITTLAGLAYEGESSLESGLQRILSHMGNFVRSDHPQVPNPVNSAEDFADKWHTTEGKRLSLEEEFWNWLNAAKEHFNGLISPPDSDFVAAKAVVDNALFANSTPSRKTDALLTAPLGVEKLSFPDKPVVPKKPQGFALCSGF